MIIHITQPISRVSNSARALVRELNARDNNIRAVLRHRSNPTPVDGVLTLPYGTRLPREVAEQHNPWYSAIRTCSNKLRFFEAAQHTGVRIPMFSTDPSFPELPAFSTVVCRSLLSASGGAGIEIVSKPEGQPLPPAKLYTQYISKRNEYRIHVVLGKIVDVQRKARRRETPDSEVDWQVRSHANGFVFARGSIELSESQLHEIAEIVARLSSINCLPPFAAIDIVDNRSGLYVLEVNSCPGITGTTVKNYANRIEEFVKDVKETE